MLRLLLRIWTGCSGLLNGVPVADVKRCPGGGGGRPRVLSCFLKVDMHSRQGVLFPAMLALPLGKACAAMLACASLWAGVCGPDGVRPFG